MGSEEAGGVDEGAEDVHAHRLKVQKKAHCTRCVMADADQRLRLLLLSWMGGPLEKLMSEVQYFDSTRRGLLDLSVDVLNPFLKCRQHLATLVFDGHLGPLSPKYDIQPIEDHVRLSGLIRGMGQDFSSQVKWRFLPMEHPRYTFGAWIHLSVTRATRLQKVTDFLKLNR